MKDRIRAARGGAHSPLSVSIPREQRTWVESRVAAGGYGNISDYIRELIRKDRKDTAKAELERKLLSALESGKRIAATPEYWAKKKSDLLQRHGRRKRAR